MRVRDREDKFPRVQEENTHYGFRRNTLALRGIALGISLTALVVDGLVLLLSGGSATALTCLGVHVLIGTVWLVVPAPAWVRQVADSYADRLFETLESPALTGA